MCLGQSPDATAELVRAVKKACGLPIWVKLTPNVTDPSQVALAAESAGADAVSLINTLKGMAIDPQTRKPLLANLTGGLSGPAIKPVALSMVYETARKVKVPVVGIGGITTGLDAAEFIIAGATAVQVGTANFVNPRASIEVVEGLEEYCREQGIESIGELRGSLSA